VEDEMTEEPQGRAALTDEFLAQVRSAFTDYDEAGDVWEKARLVREIGKSYAPELLGEVDRLREENEMLREALIKVVEALAEVESTVNRQAEREEERLREALLLARALLAEG